MTEALCVRDISNARQEEPQERTFESLFLAFDVPPAVHDFCGLALDRLAGSDIQYARKRNTPPHMTVKAPFAVRVDRMPAIVETLHGIVETGTVQRFAVELGEVDEFNNGALHLVVGGGAVVRAMKAIIGPLISLGCRRGVFEGQSPHITIAKIRNGSRAGPGKRLIESLGPPKGRFSVETLVVYHRAADANEWTSRERLLLR